MKENTKPKKKRANEGAAKKINVPVVGRIPNQAHVYNARYGTVGGGKFLFTHRDPQTGGLWAEDMPKTVSDGVGGSYPVYGKWTRMGAAKLE